VIGHNALHARTQGGGSATVLPEKIVTPVSGIRAALPGAEVSYSVGAVVQQGIAELPLHQIVNPATGENGMLVRFLDAEGTEMYGRTAGRPRWSTSAETLRSRRPPASSSR
jgi:beta-glucosidase